MQSTVRTVWLSWTYEIFIDPASLRIDRLVGLLFIDPSFRKQTHHRSDIAARLGLCGHWICCLQVAKGESRRNQTRIDTVCLI